MSHSEQLGLIFEICRVGPFHFPFFIYLFFPPAIALGWDLITVGAALREVWQIHPSPVLLLSAPFAPRISTPVSLSEPDLDSGAVMLIRGADVARWAAAK